MLALVLAPLALLACCGLVVYLVQPAKSRKPAANAAFVKRPSGRPVKVEAPKKNYIAIGTGSVPNYNRSDSAPWV
jgi:hypothetical protein